MRNLLRDLLLAFLTVLVWVIWSDRAFERGYASGQEACEQGFDD